MAPSQLLTRMDMSDGENAKDAQAELHRAANDPAKLAVWAAKWGAALVTRCLDIVGDVTDEPEEGSAAPLQAEIEAFDKAVKEACDTLGGIGPGTMLPATAATVGKVVDELRAML